MSIYRLLADVVLILHAGVILFVVGGLIAIVLGILLKWEWVRNRWFRIAHLLAIAYVVLQAYAGLTCPLTDLENFLRIQAGEQPYAPEGFIAHWLHQLIFFDAEAWVFTLAYTLFGLAVVVTMILAPPRWSGTDKRVTRHA